jgi:hypothetical protein
MVHEGLSAETEKTGHNARRLQRAAGSSDGNAIRDCELAVLLACFAEEDSPKVASSLDQQLRSDDDVLPDTITRHDRAPGRQEPQGVHARSGPDRSPWWS